jgi:23S rRNA (cytidine1920-2'-O)/16S rRNA (cytidine1409-2'-O)-methyltransferase
LRLSGASIELKKRIDKLLVERGLAETREKAQALIMAGNVLVGDAPATKAGMPVAENADVRLKEPAHPYVSRGGVKLEGAVRAFGIAIQGKICLDVGSSTGGFTHFLLLNDALRVYALDVDVKQLDWKIRNDARVHTIELNARFLCQADVVEAVDLVTIDASFISLTMLLPRIPAVMKSGGQCLALVKPQFEVGREHVGKGGIVRDSRLQTAAIEKVAEAGRTAGMEFVGSHESPITGREGNREFFALFRKP